MVENFSFTAFKWFETFLSALNIWDGADGVDFFVVAFSLIFKVGGGSVDDGELVVYWTSFTAGIDEPWFAVVVLGESPLSAVRSCRLYGDHLFRSEFVASEVVGGVDPVV